MVRVKALSVVLAALAAGSLVTPQTAFAQRGFHGGWGGGWRGGWHGGGWGWGGAALGLGLGLAAAGAIAGPYGYGYGYGYPGYYGYGYPVYYGGYSDCHLVRRWGPYGPHLVQVCYVP